VAATVPIVDAVHVTSMFLPDVLAEGLPGALRVPTPALALLVPIDVKNASAPPATSSVIATQALSQAVHLRIAPNVI
jgi:hypothetical protein